MGGNSGGTEFCPPSLRGARSGEAQILEDMRTVPRSPDSHLPASAPRAENKPGAQTAERKSGNASETKSCVHPRVQIVAREEDAEFVECLECREVFESSEFKDMAIEEKIEDGLTE